MCWMFLWPSHACSDLVSWPALASAYPQPHRASWPEAFGPFVFSVHHSPRTNPKRPRPPATMRAIQLTDFGAANHSPSGRRRCRAAGSARRRYEDPARLGAKGGVSREPSRPSQVGGLRLGNAWRQKFLATPAASFWRRQLSPSHASRHSRALAIDSRAARANVHIHGDGK